MRRLIFISLVVLVLLLAVVLGAGWYLVHDEDFLKTRLNAFVGSHTGRELSVDGPLHLDLGRQITIEARGIRFQNAAWAGPDDMVSIGHLRAAIDLPSLFSDRPIIPSLLLEECEIHLVENEAGERNWDVLPQTEGEPAERPESDAGPLVALLNARVLKCRATHDSPDREQPLRLAVEELAIGLIGTERWEAAGAGQLDDDRFSFAGNLGPPGALLHGQPVSYDFGLELGDIALESSGSVEDPSTGRGADLAFRFSGPEMAEVLTYFSLPAVSDGAFDFRLKLASEQGVTNLSVDGDLGSVMLDATGHLDRLLQPQSGAVQAELSGPDLRALGEALRVEGLVSEPYDIQIDLLFDEGVTHAEALVIKTPRDRLEISGILGRPPEFAQSELAVHANTEDTSDWKARAGLPEATVGPATLDGLLESDDNGRFSVKGTLGFAGSALDVAGELGTLEGTFEPDLEFSLRSPDAAALAARFGFDKAPSAPASMQGHVAVRESMLHLRGAEAVLGNHRAGLDGVFNPAAPFTGTAVALHLDSPNLAELGPLFGQQNIPAGRFTAQGRVSRPDQRLKFDDLNVEFTGHRARIDGYLNPDEDFIGSELEIQLDSPDLAELGRLAGQEALPPGPLTVQGRVSRPDRRLQFKELELDLAGHRAVVDGYLNPEKGFAGSEIEVRLDSPDVGNLALLFGTDGLPHEALNLTAVLRQEGQGLAFRTSQGSVGEIALEIDGRMPDLGEPMGLDADFDLRLPSLALLAFLAPEAELPDLPFSARGRLRNEQARTRLDNVKLELGAFTADVSGALFTDQRFAVTLAARGPDASQLEPWVGRPLQPLPVSVSANFEGSPTAFEVSNLEARLGPSEVEGALQIGLGEPRSISGRLESSYLDASPLRTDEPEEEPADATQQSPWVFDETPVVGVDDFGTDLDLALKVAELDLGNSKILDIDLGIGLAGRRLELNPLAMRGVGGGTVSGNLVLDASGAAPELQLDVTAGDLRLGLAAAEDQDFETYPPVDAEIMLAGIGATQREMAASLNGKVRFYSREGQVAIAGVSLILNDFLTELFTALNPFSEKSEYTTLNCSVTAATIVDGQVDVFPVVYQTRELTILSQGKIDLHTEKIDLSFNTRPRKGIGISAGVLINPLIKVGGTLAKPAIQLDSTGVAVSGGLAVATAGLSLLAKSTYDRFLSSKDPCGDARKEIDRRDQEPSP